MLFDGNLFNSIHWEFLSPAVFSYGKDKAINNRLNYKQSAPDWEENSEIVKRFF